MKKWQANTNTENNLYDSMHKHGGRSSRRRKQSFGLTSFCKEYRKENDKRRPAGNSFDRYRSDRDYQPGEI